jgi:hypothetical protein
MSKGGQAAKGHVERQRVFYERKHTMQTFAMIFEMQNKQDIGNP